MKKFLLLISEELYMFPFYTIPSNLADGGGRNYINRGKTWYDFRDSNMPLGLTDGDARNINVRGKTWYNYHESNAEVCIFHDFYNDNVRTRDL